MKATAYDFEHDPLDGALLSEALAAVAREGPEEIAYAFVLLDRRPDAAEAYRAATMALAFRLANARPVRSVAELVVELDADGDPWDTPGWYAGG